MIKINSVGHLEWKVLDPFTLSSMHCWKIQSYLHRMLIQIYLQECTLSTNLKICLHLASFLLAVKRKSLISWICLGYKSGIKLSLYSSITANHYVNTFKENQYHHYCYSVLNMIEFLQKVSFLCVSDYRLLVNVHLSNITNIL